MDLRIGDAVMHDQRSAPAKSALDAWFVGFKRVAPRPPRLLCLAGAGAFASEFCHWPDAFGGRVGIAAVSLPGRERRIREAGICTMSELVERMLEAVDPWLADVFSLFGHSLGAWVMFEAAWALRARGVGTFKHLFVSGQPSPRIRQVGPPPSSTDEELIDFVRMMGGAPEDVLSNKAFMRAYLPGLRADLALFEKYRYVDRGRLDCPITAYVAAGDDEATPAEVARWADETSGKFSLVSLSGGHLFLRSDRGALTASIERAMLSEAP